MGLIRYFKSLVLLVSYLLFIRCIKHLFNLLERCSLFNFLKQQESYHSINFPCTSNLLFAHKIKYLGGPLNLLIQLSFICFKMVLCGLDVVIIQAIVNGFIPYKLLDRWQNFLFDQNIFFYFLYRILKQVNLQNRKKRVMSLLRYLL